MISTHAASQVPEGRTTSRVSSRWAQLDANLGLTPHLENDLLDDFYFSMASLQNIGDLYPSGVMGLMAGVESLNGLVLPSAT